MFRSLILCIPVFKRVCQSKPATTRSCYARRHSVRLFVLAHRRPNVREVQNLNKLKSFAPKTGYNIRRSVSYLFHTPTPSSLHATLNDLKRSPPSQSRRHNLLLDVIISPHNAKCEPSLPHTLSVCTSASPTAFILARKLASAQRRLTKSICVRSRECGWQICDV